MGNGFGKICLCSSGVGEISRRYEMFPSNSYEKSLGNSICYTRPDPFRLSSCSNIFSDEDSATQMTFRSISGASVSANSSTPPSIYLANSSQHGASAFDATASFESSTSFTSMPLHYHQPRGSSVASSGTVSSPLDGRFSYSGSGPIGGLEPRLNGSSLQEEQQECTESVKFKRTLSDRKNGSLIKPNNSLKKIFRRAISSVTPIKGVVSIGESTSEKKKNDEDEIENDEGCAVQSMNFQWAQGRAGEDRIHIVISEDDGWVFVGIYDGFNGPDATDYLLNNLFWSVHAELKELLSNGNSESANEECLSHSDVLTALSEALRKAEDEFLKDSDDTITKDPVLAMMGSCVLVVLMKGDDVYVMNAGDSRAVLAQSSEHGLNSLQLTVDHGANVKEEVQRIRREHPDDPSAVTKGRVKGHLNVTRAFGAGFLKQPKYNNAVLETFRVDYIGDSPYITCSPSLKHHTLSPSDRFLILSSDGLYQYFTNEEAVYRVEFFMTLYPEIDPAQLLIEEALARAATKAGMDFHELLEIPQGERRLFHDDISIVIISLEGKIWRSSASYTH
ncbi:probable protein phosphatase 2C 4 [Neltuma alba]|uniref:probable protein phosphatase 2C 4 n=1 Tax=Neltuma alba TaxID=207710 RepID=UPI0010A341F7|nr:probable protein phosphatase 2C 4 [Prosopis alba]